MIVIVPLSEILILYIIFVDLSKTVKFSDVSKFSIELPASVIVSKYSFNSLSWKAEMSSTTNSKNISSILLRFVKDTSAPASKLNFPENSVLDEFVKDEVEST